MEGRLPRMTLGQRPTCSFLSRGKYDVFPIMPGSNATWCPRMECDWVGIWDLQRLRTLPKTCHRKGCAGEPGGCDKPQTPSPRAVDQGEACISTDLITLAGQPGLSADLIKISSTLALPRAADLAGMRAVCTRTGGLLGGWTDQIKILVWVAPRAKPFPMRRPRLSISDWTPQSARIGWGPVDRSRPP